MNDLRREQLRKALSFLESASDIVSSALDEEQDCLDNIPENFQYSDRYEIMESIAEKLEEAIGDIDGARDKIEDAVL